MVIYIYIMIHYDTSLYFLIYHDTLWCIMATCDYDGCYHYCVSIWTTDCDIVILFVQSGFGAPKGARKVLESSLPAFDVKLGRRCASQKAAVAASILQTSYIHKPIKTYINRVHSFTSDTCPFPACLDSCDKLMFDRNVLVIPKAKATCCHRDSPRPPVTLPAGSFPAWSLVLWGPKSVLEKGRFVDGKDILVEIPSGK